MRLAYHRITPVTPGPYIDLLKENIDKAKRPGTLVDIKGPKRSIKVFQSVYRAFRFFNDHEVLESMWESYQEGYEAIALNCFYDPCLDIAREIMDIPIVGPAETSMLMASLMGAKFGIVTFHPKAVPDYENMIKTYGFEKKALAHPVRSLKQNFDEQMEGVIHPQSTVEDFRERAKELIKDGAEVIIPGCLMLSPILVKSGVNEVEGAPVLDVVSIVIKFAEFMDEMLKAGLPIISRRGQYQGPDKKLVGEIRAIFGL